MTENVVNSASPWPDTIHDALAAAGKEMTRLAEHRQTLASEFSDWLTEFLEIDEGRFSGMSYIRGGQASFDVRDWAWFVDLLRRNQRVIGQRLDNRLAEVEKRYDAVVEALTLSRQQFQLLDSALDRVNWQLVGLASDGGIPIADGVPEAV